MSDLGVYGINGLLQTALRNEGFKRVTFGDINEKDLQDQTIYPFAHLTLSGNIQTSQINTFTYEVAILDLVDVNSDAPRDSKNQLSLTNNIEDVFHNLSFKWNRAWQSIKKDVNQIVELPDAITLQPGYAEVQNKLAGYTITFNIIIPNSGIC